MSYFVSLLCAIDDMASRLFVDLLVVDTLVTNLRLLYRPISTPFKSKELSQMTHHFCEQDFS